MPVRPALLLSSAVALGAALLAACGSTPGADAGAAPARPAAPVLYSRSLTGTAAAAAILEAMDAADLQRLGQALEPTRAGPQRWQGARGHDFLLTPLGTFAGDHGACREFQVDATRGGLTERWRGAACQQADRRWQVLR